MNPYWTRTVEHVVSEGWIDRRSSSGTCGICAVATVSTTTRFCSTLLQRRLRASAGGVPVGCATVH
jgi:hypothetical protein